MSKPFVPSEFQKRIFSFITASEGNLVIEAVAGSGKSTTLVKALEMISDKMKCLFLAFNKNIADELKDKVPWHVDAKTTHSVGFATIKKSMRNAVIETDKFSMIWERRIITWASEETEATEQRIRGFYSGVKRMLSLAKGLGIAPEPYCTDIKSLQREDDMNMWRQMIIEYGFDFDDIQDDIEDTIEFATMLTRACLDESIKMCDEGIIDFDDMLYMPIIKNYVFKKYDWVFVDESQDMNRIQMLLLRRIMGKNSRLVAVGDRRQCQPADTMVVTPSGEICISKIKKGDIVTSWDRKGQVLVPREVKEVGVRNFSGDMYYIRSFGKYSKCTPNHKWVARWNPKTIDSLYVTYLMEREDCFRVGHCKLFSFSVGKNGHTFHLPQRARLEKAEKAWILSVHNSKKEATLEENYISTKYGLSMMIFNPLIQGNYSEKELMSTHKRIPQQRERAIRVLTSHSRDIEFPIWEKGTKRTRFSIMEVETCNLIPEAMLLPHPTERRKVVWERFSIEIKKVLNIPVYSLSVDDTETYISNGMITHNSIYAWRGSDSAAMDVIKRTFECAELPLSVCYRCPSDVIALARKETGVHQITAHEKAEKGVVQVYGGYNHEIFKMGDMVLCRNNAPLVKLAYRLLAREIPVIIRGKDVAQEMIKLVEKLSKKNNFLPLDTLKVNLYDWRTEEMRKAAKMPSRQALIENKFEVCNAFIEAAIETGEESRMYSGAIKKMIIDIYSDKNESNAVVFSSVHKAKGLEADRVFILDKWLMPSKYAKTQEARDQEKNLLYVAITRAKKELYFINTDSYGKKTFLQEKETAPQFSPARVTIIDKSNIDDLPNMKMGKGEILRNENGNISYMDDGHGNVWDEDHIEDEY